MTEPDLELEDVVDISIAARHLKISVSSIYRMFYDGQIELVRRGPRKGYRVPISEIKRLAYIKAQRAVDFGVET